jgi:hypothetical protein
VIEDRGRTAWVATSDNCFARVKRKRARWYQPVLAELERVTHESRKRDPVNISARSGILAQKISE